MRIYTAGSPERKKCFPSTVGGYERSGMKVDSVLIRSIQIEATWFPVPQHVQTICLLLGFGSDQFIIMALIQFVWASECVICYERGP